MVVKDYIVIGGGSAGYASVLTLKEENPNATVLWISNEDRFPYKRTKINKHIASGFAKEDFSMVDHDWLVNNHVDLLYDQVEKIDPNKHELSFLHRGPLKYNKLIIATGSQPNTLNIEGLPKDLITNVYTARHVENIIRNAPHVKSYLIIGAGVEGVETADQLVEIGKNVVLIDRNPFVLQRFLTPKFSELLQKTIQNNGVELILNVSNISYQETDDDKVFIDIEGNKMFFDKVISTIGYKPNITLALNSNIKCNRGILVNEFLESSVEDVYAAGDVAEHPNGTTTGLWHAAEHQGKIAALNAIGKKTRLTLLPFRMKTEVFGEYYFSKLPEKDEYEIYSETNNNIVRDMYFHDNQLVGLLMCNDGERAKIYQKALLEQWELAKIHKELPI